MARTRDSRRRGEPDDGASAPHGPERTCVGCRSRGPASELLRVVAADGALVPDPRRREPGRGAWLHPGASCLHRAERRSAFPRALRVPGPLDTAALHALLGGGPTPSTGPDQTRPAGRVRTRKQVDPYEPAVKHSR